MDSNSFSSILTAISLNLLRKIGSKSTVISTVSVALGLVDQSLESGEPLPAEITQGVPGFDLPEFKEKLESLKAKFERKNLSSTLWRFPFSVHREKTFHKTEDDSETLDFISMDYDENFRISCDQDANKWAEDEDFKVLNIPMSGSCFSIFSPKSQGFENLDAERFQFLLGELSPTFVDFEIPAFKIRSSLRIHELFDLPSEVSVEKEFEVRDETDGNDENCRVISKRSTGIIKPPCETDPIRFQANRPFLFSVMIESVPLVMGVFSG